MGEPHRNCQFSIFEAIINALPVLWNMLKGERAGGNCINYMNVAY
jgi:hypothetical protein